MSKAHYVEFCEFCELGERSKRGIIHKDGKCRCGLGEIGKDCEEQFWYLAALGASEPGRGAMMIKDTSSLQHVKIFL